RERADFFALKLVYHGEELVQAVLWEDGRERILRGQRKKEAAAVRRSGTIRRERTPGGKRHMDKKEVLKKYFGYDGFREGQETLIDGILQGQDV
ncbi:MAG: hypothetical protein LUC27_02835, partial [Lachnospiraceae bacterium]|nr:hypothetical protein [Lachnospiraceae bacterium]